MEVNPVVQQGFQNNGHHVFCQTVWFQGPQKSVSEFALKSSRNGSRKESVMVEREKVSRWLTKIFPHSWDHLEYVFIVIKDQMCSWADRGLLSLLFGVIVIPSMAQVKTEHCEFSTNYALTQQGGCRAQGSRAKNTWPHIPASTCTNLVTLDTLLNFS